MFLSLAKETMKKYLAEFIGTFFLILTIGLTVNSVTAIMAPVAIGCILIVMIYACGHISGAHFNPAVTLAILIRKKIGISDAIPYILFQLAGAAAASYMCIYLNSDKPATEIMPLSIARSVVAEIVGTFVLVFVILNVATAKATAGNMYFGLAIGLTVTAMAYSLGSISGGAFNPAVALATSLMKMTAWYDIWIFLVGNFSGAILAAVLFNFINKEE